MKVYMENGQTYIPDSFRRRASMTNTEDDGRSKKYDTLRWYDQRLERTTKTEESNDAWNEQFDTAVIL